jgi:hypothetical protein
LQKQPARIDLGMIVGQQIERHRGNLRQQFVERRRVGRGGNVVEMPGSRPRPRRPIRRKS